MYIFEIFLQYNALKVVGGESGKLLDSEVQKGFMRSLCSNLFTDELKTKMTWTGKTNIKGVKKIALKTYKRTLRLIYKLAKAADKTINGEKILVYSVLKYAYRHAKADDAIDDTASALIIESNTQVVPAEAVLTETNGQISHVPTVLLETSSLNEANYSQQFQSEPTGPLRLYQYRPSQFSYPHQYQNPIHTLQHVPLQAQRPPQFLP